MRFFVLALMIALLPLRGWAGEVMATEMASSQMGPVHKQAEVAINLVATNTRHHWDKATFEGQKTLFDSQNQIFETKDVQAAAVHDCEGHAKTDEVASAGAHCDSCPACQACHTVALSAPAVDLNLTFSSRTQPRPAAAHFASATAALSQKPPIS